MNTTSNVTNKAIQAISNGVSFSVDFANRSLRIGKKYVIKNGQHQENLGYELLDTPEFLAKTEELYDRYRHSTPSATSESKRRYYFLALRVDELSDEDMYFGEPREIAQATLEIFVLSQIILGFQWNPDTMGKWFWKSETHPDLVLLRQWFQN
jgi:hypothetical protein